jgi:hypothetical protein
MGVLNRDETNVPGRNSVVIKARTFMLCASLLVTKAICRDSSAIFWADAESFADIKLNSYE